MQRFLVLALQQGSSLFGEYRLPNTLNCSGFPAGYPSLSGTLSLSASHLDITRAMLTVGYPSRRQALLQVGRWRATLLRAMARGYLHRDLSTTEYFRKLEQSEKAAMSFLIAQAFTYWFAQTHMGLHYVVHVQGCRARFAPATSRIAMKAGADGPKQRARPDFIGFSSAGHHVFESKGRSGSLSSSLMATALSQASMIATINGSPPQTRVAACFSFRRHGVTGRVRDPALQAQGNHLAFDEVMAAEKVYALFLDPNVRDSSAELIPGYRCIELDEGFTYGLDTKVLSELEGLRSRKGDDRRLEPLLALLDDRRPAYEGQRAEDVSIGNEGVILSSARRLQPRRHTRHP